MQYTWPGCSCLQCVPRQDQDHILDCFSTMYARLGLKEAADLCKVWCEPHLLKLSTPNCVSAGVAPLRGPQVKGLLSINRKWELISLLHGLPVLTSCCTFKYVNLVWFTQMLSSSGCPVSLSLLFTFVKSVCVQSQMSRIILRYLLIIDSFQRRWVDLWWNWCSSDGSYPWTKCKAHRNEPSRKDLFLSHPSKMITLLDISHILKLSSAK